MALPQLKSLSAKVVELLDMMVSGNFELDVDDSDIILTRYGQANELFTRVCPMLFLALTAYFIFGQC